MEQISLNFVKTMCKQKKHCALCLWLTGIPRVNPTGTCGSHHLSRCVVVVGPPGPSPPGPSPPTPSGVDKEFDCGIRKLAQEYASIALAPDGSSALIDSMEIVCYDQHYHFDPVYLDDWCFNDWPYGGLRS